MKIWSRLNALFRRRKFEAEMAEEMRVHLDMLAERKRAAGMDAEEARYAARREFGGVEQIKERVRDGWRLAWIEDAGRDLRYAVRALRKNPGFAATAVLTLALGVGVNAALFIVYDVVALRALPSRDPERLVEIRGRNLKARGYTDPRFSYPDYQDIRAANHTLSDVVAVAATAVQMSEGSQADATETNAGEPSALILEQVSRNYFAALGGEIALGRDFLAEEADVVGGRPAIILSHRFWERNLGSNPQVLGRPLSFFDLGTSTRELYTIVGVAEPEFVGQSAAPPVGWVPLTTRAEPLKERSRHWLFLIGRARDGVQYKEAKADLDVVVQRISEAYPDEHRATSVALAPAMRIFNVGMSRGLFVAMSPVVLGFLLVLVIACLNVANLLLARGVTRQHEIGVRLTLGAGRGRVARQLFVENFLLCVLGAGSGLLLAVWLLNGLRPVVAAMLEGQPEGQTVVEGLRIGIDGRIVACTALLALVAGVTAGVAPALHASRRDLFSALKGVGSVFGRGVNQSRLRHGLVVAQVAVCLTLLSVAGLFAANFFRAQENGAGFETDRVYYAQFVEQFAAEKTAGAAALVRDAVERLRTLPGVEAAGGAERIPLRTPGNNLGRVEIRLPRGAAAEASESVGYNRVSPGFLETMRIGLAGGRTFTAHEWATDAAVAMVTESAAKAWWPGENPLGQSMAVNETLFGIRPEPGGAPTYRDCRVVGVVRDFRSNWSATDDARVILFPLAAQQFPRGVLFRVRTDTADSLGSVLTLAREEGIPLRLDERLSSLIGRGLLAYRVFAWVSGALAMLALVLATIGLYGVMSFTVNQRVNEIGVRVALGASAGDVIGLFVRRGMRLVAIGMAAGSAGGVVFTIFATKVMPAGAIVADGSLRETVFGLVAVLLTAVAGMACWLPARRAAKVDPMVALRCD